MKRCSWVPEEDPLYVHYHDNEWGVPVHEDRKLFEFLILEGAQSGLSWRTILAKREGYLSAFDNFDPQVVANYSDSKIEELTSDPGIIRNRLKIIAAIHNARAFITVQHEFGSFDSYIWELVGGSPLNNGWIRMSQVPSRTDLSDRLSRDLKKRGFKFVGSKICYAFMQAVGLVNDHTMDCFRYDEIRLGR